MPTSGGVIHMPLLREMNEIQCEDYSAIGLRFHTIWPGRDDMLFMKFKNNQVEYINRKHNRDFVHVDDIISAIYKLINNFESAIIERRVYDIGTGHRHSCRASSESIWL